MEEMSFKGWVIASQAYRRSAFQAEQAAEPSICVCARVRVLGGGTEISHTLAALISPEGNRVFLGNFGSAEE